MARVQRSFNIKRLARALQGFSLKPDEPRLIVNRMLFDTTVLLNKSPEEIEAGYQRNPLILLGLMEISNFASLFGGETDWARFFQLFRKNPPATTFVHFLTPEPELENYDCPGLLISQAEEPAHVIPFVQNVLRYAHNFFLWEERDLFSLVSLLRSRLMAAVVVNEAPDEFDQNLLRSLHHLSIPIFSRVPLGPMFNYNLISDLDDLFAKIHRLQPVFNARKIKRVEGNLTAIEDTERFEVGGGYSSFCVVRAMGGIDGVEVRGKMEDEAGLIIDLGDSDVDITLTAYLENELHRIFARHPWVRMEPGEFFKLVLIGKMREPEEVGWEIYRRLKEKFALTQVSVKLIFDSLRLQNLKAIAAGYKEERRHALAKRGDFDAPLFVCTFCQRCSRNGFCFVSVLHPPQCELSYDGIRARALFTGSLEHFPIKRGELVDKHKVFYSGVSKFARILSEGGISKVSLQSLLDSPPPVTVFAQNIAYYNEHLEGIVVLSCDYDGHSPDQRTFFGLLREVAGRQVPGVMGVSDDYLRSRDFLAAEGGLKRVVWMPSLLKERLGLQKFTFIATERECNNTMSLRSFLKDKGFCQ